MRHYVVWLTDSVIIQTTTNNLLHQISRLSDWHSCLVFQKFPNLCRNPSDITQALITSFHQLANQVHEAVLRETISIGYLHSINSPSVREPEHILSLLYLYRARNKITQLSITHAQLQRHRLKFIKNHLKNSYMIRSSTIFRELQCPR